MKEANLLQGCSYEGCSFLQLAIYASFVVTSHAQTAKYELLHIFLSKKNIFEQLCSIPYLPRMYYYSLRSTEFRAYVSRFFTTGVLFCYCHCDVCEPLAAIETTMIVCKTVERLNSNIRPINGDVIVSKLSTTLHVVLSVPNLVTI